MTNRTMQRETVVGVFSNRESAQRAIEMLKSAGFSGDDIGVLMQNKDDMKSLAADTGTKAGEGAATGATAGGVLGAIGGLLVGLGALAIPGIGPVLAAGPLAAALGPIIGGTLTGAAIGAGTGAIAGALVGLGIPEDEANMYEQRFRQGDILVTVRAGADRYDDASFILQNAGAAGIESGAQAAMNAGATTGDSARVATTATTAATSGQTTAATSGQANYAAQSSNVTTATGSDTLRVPVVEEQLTANKQAHEAGEVAIHKHVVEEQVNIPVELRHEEVTVTRHAVDRPIQEGEQILQDGQVIRVPIHEEVANVQKEARVTGEVEVNKHVVSQQHNVSDTVRREVVDVDTDGNLQLNNNANAGQTTYTEEDVTTNDTRDTNRNR